VTDTRMIDRYTLRIDLEKLRRRLCGGSHGLTIGQVREGLYEWGFQLQADGTFVCRYHSLSVLEPSEILERRRL
jgi:hypothetical protein